LHISTFTTESREQLESLLPQTKEAPKKSPSEWQDHAQMAFAGNRKVLQNQWKRIHKRLTDDQAPIYPFLTRYADLLITTQSRKVQYCMAIV
jgi:hypothetical protein